MSLPALTCKGWIVHLAGDGTGALRDKNDAKMAVCRWDPEAVPVKQDFKAKAIMYGTVAGGWRALVLEGGETALVFREGKHVAECKVQWPVMDQLRLTDLPAHHIG